jgi:protein-arginine kinase activator protein McsA
MKCDQCDNSAAVHLCNIDHGKKTEQHLCIDCAQKILQGFPVKKQNINELLQKFAQEHCGSPNPPDQTGV